MIERDEIRNTVFRALAQVKELSLDESGVASEESDVLVGDGAGLDSMGFVNFVVALEEEMSRISDQPLNLLELFNSPESKTAPISTVRQLIDSLYHLLQRCPLS
jgi:acyl carrier protein